MRTAIIVTGLVTAALAAAAFWADGSSNGESTVNPVILGIAAAFSATRSDKSGSGIVIGSVYLSSLAILSVAAQLVDSARGLSNNFHVLPPGLTIPAALMAAGVLDLIIRKAQPSKA